MAVTIDPFYQLEEPFFTRQELREVVGIFIAKRKAFTPTKIAGGTINKLAPFVKGHMAIIQHNKYNKLFEPYWLRLKALSETLKTQ